MSEPWWTPRKPPRTCEYGWHVFSGNAKRCHCGDERSPMYRNWLQRIKDKREMRKHLKARGIVR